MQDTVEWKIRRGRPGKMWLDNIKDWTLLWLKTSSTQLGADRKSMVGECTYIENCMTSDRDPIDISGVVEKMVMSEKN